MNPINTFVHENGSQYGMWYSPDKIGRAFASGSLYERPFLDWIYEQRFDGSALDIGANIGNHALWMHHVCRLHVVAFEPVIPHVLRANAALNGSLADGEPYNDGGIDVRDYALGDAPGVGYHVAKGEITTGRSEQSTDETFEIKTLDSIGLPEHVAFVKADCEGFEAKVLRGGVQFLREHKPVIAAESWTSQTDFDIAQVLQPLGYVPRETFGGRGKAPVQVWRIA